VRDSQICELLLKRSYLGAQLRKGECKRWGAGDDNGCGVRVLLERTGERRHDYSQEQKQRLEGEGKEDEGSDEVLLFKGKDVSRVVHSLYSR
jgi:hypothetical protein